MKIVITGANGFIGHQVAARLCRLGGLGEGYPAMAQLTLLSRKFQTLLPDKRLRYVKGDITQPGVLGEALQGGVDCIFHIAAIPSGDAERDFDAGRKINLEATYNLFELLRRQPRPPTVVLSSSIGVYGLPHPDRIDDDTEPHPSLSYGAQKMVCETLLTDYSRRGFFDGRSIRLSGIVSRPKNDGGAYSLFLANIFHAFAEGDPEFICPVSASGTPWLMSVERCIDNILLAARIPAEKLPLRRAWMIPPLRVRMDALVAALAEATKAKTRVVYKPAEPYESLIGNLPPVATPLAESLGFQNDGTVRALVDRVLKMIRASAATAGG